MPFLSALAVISATSLLRSSFDSNWNEIQSAISRSYYGRVSKKPQMDQIFNQYKPLALAATSPVNFKKVVNEMIEQFHDSHFAYYTTSDQGFYTMDALYRRNNALSMPNIGAWFRSTNDGFAVQMVLEGGEAQKAGLIRGDIVETIDGRPFTPVDSLKPALEHRALLQIRRGTQRLEKTVQVKSATALEMFLEATRNSEQIFEKNGRKLAYIHVWTLASDDFRNALSGAVYGKLGNTDGFILDLRDGFGGRPEGYGDPFFRPEVDFNWSSPNLNFHQQFGYQRPLVVLINEGSRSAKELLSYVFKKSRRGYLMGQTTAGNVLGTTPMRLADGNYLEIPIVDITADGTRLEGKGVEPNKVISPELDSSGHDRMIDAALAKLQTSPLHKLNSKG